MADRATPNLPSRDFELTSQLYARLGFGEVWRDAGWMILDAVDLPSGSSPTPTSTLPPVRSAAASDWMTSMPFSI